MGDAGAPPLHQLVFVLVEVIWVSEGRVVPQ
jgi:hypothetical protein